MEYMPVQCGPKNCVYGNKCGAEAAGFTEEDCCPAAPDGTMCSKCNLVTGDIKEDMKCLNFNICIIIVAMEYAPVQCGESSCLYSNQCGATAAGFPEEECCPAPSSDIMCSK